MERFTFSRQADGTLHAPDATKAAVALAFRQSPGTLSRDIINAAAADLERQAKELMFTTDKSYAETSKHLMELHPWLALATAAIGDDRADRALGIEIVGGAQA